MESAPRAASRAVRDTSAPAGSTMTPTTFRVCLAVTARPRAAVFAHLAIQDNTRLKRAWSIELTVPSVSHPTTARGGAIGLFALLVDTPMKLARSTARSASLDIHAKGLGGLAVPTAAAGAKNGVRQAGTAITWPADLTRVSVQNMPVRSVPRQATAQAVDCPAGPTFRQTTGHVPTSRASWAGRSDCSDCPYGTFQPEEGQTACRENCSLGHGTEESGRAACLPCPHGKYSDMSNFSTCTVCPFGKYQDQTGQTKCRDDCAAGSYIPTGAKMCALCEPGFVSTWTGPLALAPCGDGTYQSQSGQTVSGQLFGRERCFRR